MVEPVTETSPDWRTLASNNSFAEFVDAIGLQTFFEAATQEKQDLFYDWLNDEWLPKQYRYKN